MKNKQGEIIIPSSLIPWPHEFKTARALASAGYTVEFLTRNEGQGVRSADILLNGILFEIKAPRSSKMKAVERNLRRASKQASRVVFDVRRMKGVPEEALLREITICVETRIKDLHEVVLVKRSGEVIVIK